MIPRPRVPCRKDFHAEVVKHAAAAFAAAAMFTVAGAAHAQYVVPEVQVNVAPPPPRVEVRTVASVGEPHVDRRTLGLALWPSRVDRRVTGRSRRTKAWCTSPRVGPRSAGAGPFVEGHWRWAQPHAQVVWQPPVVQPQPVYVQHEPPPVINEVRTAAPYRRRRFGFRVTGTGTATTTSGSRGRWSAPRVGYRWEPDHWVARPDGLVPRLRSAGRAVIER